jgi:hypothetical protein
VTLVTLADYRALGQDADTPDNTVTALLPVAQGLVELELGRVGQLELAAQQEELEVWNDNLVYPTAIPIDSATPGFVTAKKFRPTGTSLVHYVDPLPGFGYPSWSGGAYVGLCPRRALVSYTGGYDDTTAPYPLKLAIVRLVKTLLPGSGGLLAQAPAGTKGITVGDVSITLARALGTSVIPLDVMPLIQAYRPADATRT